MAKRRMNGEGTIFQRKDGLWRAEVTIGYDKNKKRIKKTVSSMDLETLQKKLNELKYQSGYNMLTEPGNYTVSEWVKFWLETYKKPSVKPRTYDMYRDSLERYIEPRIGHYKLDKLNPVMTQKFINDISEKGKNGKTGLSQSSVKQIYITLSQACKQAVLANILHKNPCDGIKIPKKEARKVNAFTQEEQEAFLKLCDSGSTFDNLFIFAFNTGMRMGEMLALLWEDVDLKNDKITVNNNLTVVHDYDEDAERKNKTVIDTPKTESGKREIPLTKAAKKCIMLQKDNNKSGSPFVFYSSAGTPVAKRNIYRAFNDRMEKANIPKDNITFHSMRHSFATRLLEKGADIKTVSELLGHKSIQITMDMYVDVSMSLKKDTISLLDK